MNADWPERIMVIGSSGAGKTELGMRIGEALALPVIDLDDEYWGAGWVEPPDEKWQAHQRQLVEAERWVMSGNFGSTIHLRAARAELVVLLDLPRWLCIWRLLVRSFKIRGLRQTWRLPRDCRGGPDWEPLHDYPEFLLYTWRFPRRSLPRAVERLREAGVERLIVLRSKRAVRNLDAALTPAAAPNDALRTFEEPLAAVLTR